MLPFPPFISFHPAQVYLASKLFIEPRHIWLPSFLLDTGIVPFKAFCRTQVYLASKLFTGPSCIWLQSFLSDSGIPGFRAFYRTKLNLASKHPDPGIPPLKVSKIVLSLEFRIYGVNKENTIWNLENTEIGNFCAFQRFSKRVFFPFGQWLDKMLPFPPFKIWSEQDLWLCHCGFFG